jgi:HD superfamily phosphohydrolase YqeK
MRKILHYYVPKKTLKCQLKLKDPDVMNAGV